MSTGETMSFEKKEGKRYYTLHHFYQETFHEKVFKISLNGGFSCPNKDGTCGYGGCIYCSKSGSGDFAGKVTDNLITQFEKGKQQYKKKWPTGKYIGYFQANTNTYAPVNVLKEKYEPILAIPNVIGLNIATRPDAITEECLDYLEELSHKTFLTIELGLQTIHEKTSLLINRGHTLECFETMVKKLRERNINVVIHIINGLPYETKEMMLENIRYVNKLDIQGVKIHMLHILKNTALEKRYQKKPFPLLSKQEYIEIICDQIELLNDNIVIHRLTGDAKQEDLIAPFWIQKKFCVLNDIDKELERRHTYQGFQRSILNRTHQIMETVLRQKDIVVDATIGNGHDTLFLAKKVTNGIVFGFDIQKEAIKQTEMLLKDHLITNYQLFHHGHEEMLKILQQYRKKISLITFNLGYLPGGKKEITTKKETTVKALEDSLSLLNEKGILLITIYPGHKEGKKEQQAIKEWLKSKKNYDVKTYHNTKNPLAPYLITLSKVKAKWI